VFGGFGRGQKAGAARILGNFFFESGELLSDLWTYGELRNIIKDM